MKIIKIFSNIEDPKETLYSVLMSEDEMTLYSVYTEALTDSLKHPFKGQTYKKEDGTPDRLKNAIQGAISASMWA